MKAMLTKICLPLFLLSVKIAAAQNVGSALWSFAQASLKGLAFVYGFNNNEWQEEAVLSASDGQAGDYFGTSVALTDDGAWVGSPNAGFPTHPGHGRVYFFKQ